MKNENILTRKFEELYDKLDLSSDPIRSTRKSLYFYFSTNYFNYLQQKTLDLNLDWQYIRKVEYQTLEKIICPICMSENEEILIPRILRCFHIYCLPCLLNHMLDVRQDCPICGSSVCLSQIKKLDLQVLKLQKGDKMDFVLMQKHCKTFKMQICKQRSDINSKQNNFIQKIFYINNSLFENQLLNDVKKLHEARENYNLNDLVFKLSEFVLLRKVQIINKGEKTFFKDKRTNKENKKNHKSPDKKKLLYFYQQDHGFNIFVDPLDFQYILKSKNNSIYALENKLIDLEIIDFSKHSKNLKDLKRDQRFAHIGENNIYYTVRIDMSKILSQSLFEQYNKDFENRKIKQEQEAIKQDEESRRKSSINEDFELAKILHEQEQIKWDVEDEEIYDAIDFDGNYDCHYPEIDQQQLKQFSLRFRKLSLEDFPLNQKQKKNKKVVEKQKVKQEQPIVQEDLELDQVVVIKPKKKKRRRGRKTQLKIIINYGI